MASTQEKIAAVRFYIADREKCLNADGTQRVVSFSEIVAFLNGWDAAVNAVTSTAASTPAPSA